MRAPPRRAHTRSKTSMAISDELLEILVCPQCHGDLTYDRTAEKLQCATCRLRYPIVDDIPVMLIEEAERIADA